MMHARFPNYLGGGKGREPTSSRLIWTTEQDPDSATAIAAAAVGPDGS